MNGQFVLLRFFFILLSFLIVISTRIVGYKKAHARLNHRYSTPHSPMEVAGIFSILHYKAEGLASLGWEVAFMDYSFTDHCPVAPARNIKQEGKKRRQPGWYVVMIGACNH